MRISDWSSDVCSSDLLARFAGLGRAKDAAVGEEHGDQRRADEQRAIGFQHGEVADPGTTEAQGDKDQRPQTAGRCEDRSEEHTSELQSLMRNSYAVFCLKKKTTNNKNHYVINK